MVMGKIFVLVILLVTTCKRPHPKIPPGSHTILECFRISHLAKMVRQLRSEVAFLLGKSVCQGLWVGIINSVILPITTCKRPYSKIPNVSGIVLKCLITLQLKCEFLKQFLMIWLQHSSCHFQTS